MGGLPASAQPPAMWGSGPDSPLAICIESRAQYSPAVATPVSGLTAICWTDYRAGASQIYAQVIDTLGNAFWEPGGRQVSDPSFQTSRPSIAADSEGVFIAWTSNESDGLHT